MPAILLNSWVLFSSTQCCQTAQKQSQCFLVWWCGSPVAAKRYWLNNRIINNRMRSLTFTQHQLTTQQRSFQKYMATTWATPCQRATVFFTVQLPQWMYSILRGREVERHWLTLLSEHKVSQRCCEEECEGLPRCSCVSAQKRAAKLSMMTLLYIYRTPEAFYTHKDNTMN